MRRQLSGQDPVFEGAQSRGGRHQYRTERVLGRCQSLSVQTSGGPESRERHPLPHRCPGLARSRAARRWCGAGAKRVVVEHTGYLTLGDDSGLEVDALNGAPGVHSARYAGENASDAQRIEKLLDALKDVPNDQRTARFKCAMAIAEPKGQSKVVVGVCEGKIIRESRGVHGFGYDPVFVPAGYDRTFAELGDEVKNRISHRAKALRMANNCCLMVEEFKRLL